MAITITGHFGSGVSTYARRLICGEFEPRLFEDLNSTFQHGNDDEEVSINICRTVEGVAKSDGVVILYDSMHEYDKIVPYIEECKKLGIPYVVCLTKVDVANQSIRFAKKCKHILLSTKSCYNLYKPIEKLLGH